MTWLMNKLTRRAAAQGDGGQVDGLMAWSDLERSDFFQWFGVHETGRSATLGSGWQAIRLKPGGYQDAIDLIVYVDTRQRVQRATLRQNRAWVDGGQTAKLADDLTQSFLLALAGRHPETSALARRIFSLNRGSQQILRAGPPEAPPDPLSPSAQAALDEYLGSRNRAELVEPGLLLVIDNRRTGSSEHWLWGPEPLAIDVAATTTSRHPAGRLARTTPARDRYLRYFLEASDLPDSMTMLYDHRDAGSDPRDQADFRQYGGLASGWTEWQGPRGGPISRLVDFRWEFPNAEAAIAYHRKALTASPGMGQGHPLLIGGDCHLFDGTWDRLNMVDDVYIGDAAYSLRMVVGPVVVKLYASEYETHTLQPEMLDPLAERIERRIQAELARPPEPPEPAPKPRWRVW
ncbi:MAG: hypothetical protein U0893_04255 [Chloroflexota bacterium]